MVAPGLHLDFSDGPGFKQRCRPMPGLAEAIREGLRRFPPEQGIHAWDLSYRSVDYGVVLIRRGQRISLVQIYLLPAEEAAFQAAVLDLQSRHRK